LLSTEWRYPFMFQDTNRIPRESSQGYAEEGVASGVGGTKRGAEAVGVEGLTAELMTKASPGIEDEPPNAAGGLAIIIPGTEDEPPGAAGEL
jgi:hypothetical protein